MGEVWEAEQVALGNRVAVKFIREELTSFRAELTARLEREAHSIAKIRSPHVVQLFDHGVTDDGTPYLIMELLDGESLTERLQRRGTLDLHQVVQLVAQLASALAQAHKLGIIHRDVKPDNVFVVDSDQLFVKLLDFGVAKNRAACSPKAATEVGVMVGTPHYMSPEQVKSARDADASADLWASAVVAYEALTGVPPFQGETLGAVLIAINSGRFIPPSRVSTEAVPASVNAWFERAFHHDPAMRFATAEEFSEAFEVAAAPPSRGHDYAFSNVQAYRRSSAPQPRRRPIPIVTPSPRAAGRNDALAVAPRRGASTLVLASPQPNTEPTSEAAPNGDIAVAPTLSALPTLELELPTKPPSSASGVRTRRSKPSPALKRRASRPQATPADGSAAAGFTRPSRRPPAPAKKPPLRPPLVSEATLSARRDSERARVASSYRELAMISVIVALAAVCAHLLDATARQWLVTRVSVAPLYLYPLAAAGCLAAGAKVFDRESSDWALRIGGGALMVWALCLGLASAAILSGSLASLSDSSLQIGTGLAATVSCAALACHGILRTLDELLRKPPQVALASALLVLSIAGAVLGYVMVQPSLRRLGGDSPSALTPRGS